MNGKVMSCGVAVGMLVAGIALGQNSGVIPKKETGATMTEIQKHVEALLVKQGSNCLTLEKKGKDDLVQVAREESAGKVSIKVLVNYPFAEPADKALAKVGVAMPAEWKLIEFEQGAYAKYDASRSDAKAIAGFVEAIFTKLLKTQPDSFGTEKM